MSACRYSLAVVLVAVLAGCTGMPENVSPVSGFDVNRYLGTWYEIARLDHPFERGLEHVTAEYSRLDDGGLRVVNQGFDIAKERWKRAEGKAYFTGPDNVGRLKVSFFGPFYGGYNIIELDHRDYQYSLVCGPDKSFLWILARRPVLDRPTMDRLIARAETLGFDTGRLIRVNHEMPVPAPAAE